MLVTESRPKKRRKDVVVVVVDADAAVVTK
jgi:hypothetical protein